MLNLIKHHRIKLKPTGDLIGLMINRAFQKKQTEEHDREAAKKLLFTLTKVKYEPIFNRVMKGTKHPCDAARKTMPKNQK